MLKPKIIQLPDYREYVNKEFIVTENADNKQIIKALYKPMLKGTRFKIKEIHNSNAVIKITNSREELDELGMLDFDFNRIIKNHQDEIKILEKVCKMWTDDPTKFVVDKDRPAHCINTCFNGIPANHPDKYGMAKAWYDDKGKYINTDTIMTLDYKRTDDKTNIYSYQRGRNYFYSKEVYQFIIKGKEIDLEQWVNKTSKSKKTITDWILEKRELHIKTLNKITFELLK